MFKKEDLAKDFNKGHRKRLREKFLKSPSSASDYEILEMILFSAYTRKDTRIIAKTLIRDFGSLNKVINASKYELKKNSILGESGISAIKLSKEIINRFLKKESEKITLLDNTDKVRHYCRSKIGHLKTEQLRILYINSQCKLVADEILSEGNVEQTPIYKNMIVTKATLYGAPSIILTHNHPSGDPHPSDQDLKVTKDLTRVLAELGINLIDHIIVTTNDSYSMKAGKVLGEPVEFEKDFMSEKEAGDLVNKKFEELMKKTHSL